MKNQSGLHLIELLIVLSIVSILSAAALPIYAHYAARATCLAARQALGTLALKMEEYFLEHQTYAGANFNTLKFSQSSISKHYQIKIISANDETYHLQAQALNAQDAACKILDLDSTSE